MSYFFNAVDTIIKLGDREVAKNARAEAAREQAQLNARVARSGLLTVERQRWFAEILEYENLFKYHDDLARLAQKTKNFTEEKRHVREAKKILIDKIIPSISNEVTRVQEELNQTNRKKIAIEADHTRCKCGACDSKLSEVKAEIARCDEGVFETQGLLRKYQLQKLDLSFRLASAYCHIQKYDKSLSEFSRLLLVLETKDAASSEALKVGVFGTCGFIYSELAFKLPHGDEFLEKRLEFKKEAIKNFRESLDVRPDQSLIRAYLNFEEGNFREALRWSRSDLQLNRRDISEIVEIEEVCGLKLMGRIQIELGNHEVAVGSFEKALEILGGLDDFSSLSEQESLWMLIAISYQALGDGIKERNSYRRAACINPRNSQALSRLSDLADLQAQALLGYVFLEKHLYLGTTPSEEDLRSAKVLLLPFEAKDHALGKTYLGILHYKGWGVPKNIPKARELMSTASQAGCREADFYLGEILLSVEGERENALKLIQKAADHGLAVAKYKLARLYLLELPVEMRKPSLGKIYLELAANQGHADAEQLLGYNLSRGEGDFIKDEASSLKWFKKAAKKGLPISMHNLGISYLNGWSGKKDETKAAACFKTALASGYVGSSVELTKLESTKTAAVIAAIPAYKPNMKKPAFLLQGKEGGFQFEVEAAAAASPGTSTPMQNAYRNPKPGVKKRDRRSSPDEE